MKNKSHRNFSYYIGNFLIIFSLFGFIFIFGPVIKIFLFPPVIQTQLKKDGFFITIAKIHAQSPIIEQVDPWNEKTYQEALKRGVAQAKGFAYPGEKGLIYLFAHSSGMPWEITRYNTIFLRLGELKKNDVIRLTRNGKDYIYLVSYTQEVNPEDVDKVLKNDKNSLILQTCTPIGTSLRRLLVFADLKKTTSDSK